MSAVSNSDGEKSPALEGDALATENLGQMGYSQELTRVGQHYASTT